MMGNRLAMKAALVVAGLVLAAGFAAPPAEAHVVVGVGIGVPLYAPYPYPYAYPYYYPPPPVYPPPVVYSPPPVVVTPPTPSYTEAPAQSWYYCDNPRGYYPYVKSCSTSWREVPAAPQPK